MAIKQEGDQDKEDNKRLYEDLVTLEAIEHQQIEAREEAGDQLGAMVFSKDPIEEDAVDDLQT